MMKHPFLIPFTLALTALAFPAHADESEAEECLSIEDEHFEAEISELGFGEGLWEATVVNRCEREFDALIDIELLDGDGEQVTSYMVVAVIPANNEETVSKDMHLTSSAVERIEEVDYSLSGSKQPI